jgi:4-hydroxy-3-polyprenylbenzoate decarboxylase
MDEYVVAITGASGVVYGKTLVEWFAAHKTRIFLMITDEAKELIKEELAVDPKIADNIHSLLKEWGKSGRGYINYLDYRDFRGVLASGSYRTRGMVIIPCSMRTLSAVATGRSSSLLERAADVTLKEGRTLVVVPREMPLSEIHLENMLRLKRAGTHIVPAMPAFYSGPKTVQDMVNFVVGRVLDVLEINHELYKKWK